MNTTQRGIIRWAFFMPWLLTPWYAVTNRMTIGEPTVIPLLPVDELISFTPSLVWLYLGLFPLMWLAVLVQPSARQAGQVVLSMLFCAICASVIFALWPTVFSRADLPLQVNELGMNLLHFLDTERNAMPSLHGCYTLLSAYWIWRARGAMGGMLAIVAALSICYATIAVGQHGIIDLSAGMSLGIAVMLVMTVRHYVTSPRLVCAADEVLA